MSEIYLEILIVCLLSIDIIVSLIMIKQNEKKNEKNKGLIK